MARARRQTAAPASGMAAEGAAAVAAARGPATTPASEEKGKKRREKKEVAMARGGSRSDADATTQRGGSVASEQRHGVTGEELRARHSADSATPARTMWRRGEMAAAVRVVAAMAQ
ncbi:hypothetical protein Scep_018736 [Stephania cephalantha]|uniref:Uncharacterized protein n=1 Tax=Stephania cephalantha TaxID=152367 RepID=A0AAP0NKI5_9MAGN